MDIQYSYLNGIRTYVFESRDDLIEHVIDKRSILIAINALKIVNADNKIIELINKNIGYADGAGAVWALRKHGFKKAVKIPGCELWLDIISKKCKEKSFYLIGSKQEVIERTVEKLQHEFPGINILAYRNGFLRNSAEKDLLFADLKNKQPDIIFVATGSPNQEYLMKEMLSHYPALYMGLGGSFDVYADYIKRAPNIFVALNLEWFYRLLKQPSRIKSQIQLVKYVYLNIIGRV